jgi:WD40 repeat protein
VLDAANDGRPRLVGSEPEPHILQALAFAPDGRTIAASSFNNKQPDTSHVSIRDWRAGKVVRELDAVGVPSLAFDGSGERLAIGFSDGTVEIRDVSTGGVERSFRAGSVTVMDVVFSPDGEMLATSGEDATIRLFDTDAETGAEQLELRGHDFLVSGLDFSPDGKRLVSASPDGVVRVWALELDELIRVARSELTRGLSEQECRQYRIDPCK